MSIPNPKITTKDTQKLIDNGVAKDHIEAAAMIANGYFLKKSYESANKAADSDKKKIKEDSPKKHKKTGKVIKTGLYEFEWQKKQISLNDWYSSKHWSHRVKAKKEWRKFVWDLVKKDLEGFYSEKYELELVYNSRLDPSNTMAMIKLIEDTLVTNGVFSDDSKKYCKGIKITPNMQMKSGSYKIILSLF